MVKTNEARGHERSLRSLSTQEIFSCKPTLGGLRELSYRSAYARVYEEAYAKRLVAKMKNEHEARNSTAKTKAEPEPKSIQKEPEKKFLTAQELADSLRVPISWVYARTREKGPGTMPSLKMGKYRRFELKKVLDWLSAK